MIMGLVLPPKVAPVSSCCPCLAKREFKNEVNSEVEKIMNELKQTLE